MKTIFSKALFTLKILIISIPISQFSLDFPSGICSSNGNNQEWKVNGLTKPGFEYRNLVFNN